MKIEDHLVLILVGSRKVNSPLVVTRTVCEPWSSMTKPVFQATDSANYSFKCLESLNCTYACIIHMYNVTFALI